MATIFRILITDGTQCYDQQVRLPMIRFWKGCTRCEYESLCNFRQTWQCMTKKSIEAESSEVDDDGKEAHRSNDQDTKFQSQKRKS